MPKELLGAKYLRMKVDAAPDNPVVEASDCPFESHPEPTEAEVIVNEIAAEIEKRSHPDVTHVENAILNPIEPVDRMARDIAIHFHECASAMSFDNRKQLEALCEHVFKIFRDSTGPQIGGRKFFGVTGFQLNWNSGECIEIRPFSDCRDRAK